MPLSLLLIFVFAQHPYLAVADSAMDKSYWIDSAKALSEAIKEAGDSVLPKDLQEQRAIRRGYQQRGYAYALYNVTGGDPISALLSFLKMEFWIAYSMPHRVYWIRKPDPDASLRIPGIPYPDDDSYPLNPWQRRYVKAK